MKPSLPLFFFLCVLILSDKFFNEFSLLVEDTAALVVIEKYIAAAKSHAPRKSFHCFIGLFSLYLRGLPLQVLLIFPGEDVGYIASEIKGHLVAHLEI